MEIRTSLDQLDRESTVWNWRNGSFDLLQRILDAESKKFCGTSSHFQLTWDKFEKESYGTECLDVVG